MLIRKTATRKDYRTIKDEALKAYAEIDFKALQEIMSVFDDLKRSDKIAVTVALNNLMKELQG